MSLHLVTGHAGHEHITPADHGAFYNALFLSGSYVLNSGNNFSASVITNNTIKISDGELIMQGRHVRMKPGEYEEVTIENGAQESARNDLIVARYVKDGTTGIENVSFVVIKGTSVASNPSDPAYIEGNILNGVLTADFPLYRVPLNGLNVGELVPLFEVKDSFDARIEEIIKGTKKVGNAKTLDGHGAEYFASSEILNENILEKSLTLNVGVHNYHLGNNYPTSTLPNVNYVWGSATVFIRSKGSPFVILWGIKAPSINCPPTFNYYNGAEWSGWNDLFTTAGGTVTGDITQQTEGKRVMHNLKNDKRRVYQEITTDGTYYLFDDTNKTSIIRSELDGTARFVGTASGNLPLTDATATNFSVGKHNQMGFPAIRFIGNGYIGISNDGELRAYDDTVKSKGIILHTGNSAKVVVGETAPSDTSALWVY